jgi:hypothetical protein
VSRKSNRKRRARRRDGRRTALRDRSWKFWLPVVISVVGLLLATVQYFRVTQSAVDAQRAIERDKEQQLAAAPALLAQVQTFPPEYGTWVFRDNLTQAQADRIGQEIVLKDGPDSDPIRPEFAELARELGGVRVHPYYKPSAPNLCVGSTHLKLTLTGNREQKVQLIDIKAKQLAKTAPPRGTLLFGPPEGGGEVDQVHFDLDTSDQPRAETFTDGGFRPYLDANFRYLEKGEPLVLDVMAVARDFEYEWELAIEVRYSGRNETVVVRPDGTASGDPFRTLGWTGRSPFGRIFDIDFPNRRFAPRQ